MKKLLSILLAAVLAVSLLAFPALADEDTPLLISPNPALRYAGKTVILSTGNLRGDVDVYPQIAAAKKDYEARGAEVVLVDAGNYLQGSAAANGSRGAVIYDLMDAAGYAAAGMGLAEFSYADATTGMPYHNNVTRYYTQKMLQEGTAEVTYNVARDGSVQGTLAAREPAKFRTVTGNVTADMEVYSFEASAVIETESGLKLGFFGFTDPEVKDSVQDGYITEIASPAAPALDADVTVCLLAGSGWAGVSQIADVVISAPIGGEAFVAAYVIDNETLAVTYEDVTLSGSDAAVAAIAAAAKENAPKTVGASEVILNGADSVNWAQESNLGDLVTDALAWYGKNYIDGIDATLPVIAIQNGGNCDQFLYDGDVTETDLLRALPFSPMGIGALEVTGQQLLEVLEAGTSPSEDYGAERCPGFAQVSGLKYVVDRSEDYDGGAAYGKFYRADSVNRVTVIEVNGEAFDPAAKYLLIADNYLMNGNDTFYLLKEIKESEGAQYVNNGPGVKTRDAVALYIETVLDGTVGADYAEPQGRITVRSRTFTDVPVAAYYADAVDWAYTEGITVGTGDGSTFSPEASVTRAQAVTFLWRASGEPEPETEAVSFTDVDESAYYFKAVRWAVEQGITVGTGDGRNFSPDDSVTAEQMITFQWRAAGKPGATEAPAEYYDDAVAWAGENALLEGTAQPFTVGADCPRADVVTYLYRAMAGV